ncbi:tyrosine integrase [Mycobacterium phage Tapioca]|uniref:Integrase n=10 Tax=Charlievirus TaxID=1623280 RepID=A0A142K7V6_9CAUD|nr:tyrosine-type recombinase/integrase [Mycobacterium phage Carcharodon]YP_009616889.1 tyrosine-type recombinase/integrase [Mycobacterium phage Pipsqueaks]YP_010052172.1 tyrosine-type recombinase/integrase [Mycobacterium phage Fulbright]YP_010052310.1 tyrosine-type recombinase/integrase [Mycobacterium phage Tapioca]AMS01982.1 tyrosine integrase [Mycobacterium phage Xerxes]AWY04118.1 tyrosine integrase [Mycobacterium phage Silvafighter]AYQ98262.1 tyrosine integrase [Mycobacterium phage Chewbac
MATERARWGYRSASNLEIDGFETAKFRDVNNSSMATLGLDDWEIWQTAQRLSRRTIDERLRVIHLLHAETGVQPMKIRATDLVRWIADHEDWSDSTACTYTSYLSAWFKWLQLTDRREDNPMVKVGAPRLPDRQPRPVSDADVVALLQTRMWTSTRRMILLALLAGLRVHEIAKIRGEDIDMSARVLWVKGKGKRLRSVPLHPLLIEMASEMPAAGYWFPMRGHEGEHILSKSVSDIIGRTMKRAGVRGTPHCLRHWYATTLLDNGTDIRVVQELLRHKSIATTQIYTKVPEGRMHDAITSLDPWRALRPLREQGRPPLSAAS